jgi:integrase
VSDQRIALVLCRREVVVTVVCTARVPGARAGRILRDRYRAPLLPIHPAPPDVTSCHGDDRRRKRDTHDRVISRDDVLKRLLPCAPERYRGIIATAAEAGLRWAKPLGFAWTPSI